MHDCYDSEDSDYEVRVTDCLAHKTQPAGETTEWSPNVETWVQKFVKRAEGQLPKMTRQEMYHKLQSILIGLEDMIKFGFPIPRNDWSVGLGACDRCEKRIPVDVNGIQVKKEACQHHKGNFLRLSKAGNRLYSCCPIANPGCVEENSHLISKPLELPEGYSKTSEKKTFPGIYAIDAEMCDVSLAGGILIKEVVQLAIIDCVSSKVVYKEILRPEDPVYNANTFVHGLTRHQIESAEISVRECRQKFLELISSDSILVGHDIKSDLRALKIVHYKIIDTQHAFPHPLGGNNKMSLRQLLKEKLDLEIDSLLHDPEDDAYACMFLVHSLLK